MTARNRDQLMQAITEASFAIDDSSLFLDTHPSDQDAMEYYQTYRAIRNNLMNEYRDCYGPISRYDVNADNEWTWINDPWPWEGEC